MPFEEKIAEITAQLTPHLLKDPWKARALLLGAHPLAGHCYVASEVLFHWVAKDAGYKPRVVKHQGATHWFLQNADGERVDITAAQFNTPIPYEKSRGVAFITREMSSRARILSHRVLEARLSTSAAA